MSDLRSAKPSLIQKKEFEEKFVTALGTGQLDIQAYKLTTIPSNVYELSNLRRLLMQNNCLENIGPQIGALSNLVGLYLNDNCLVDLPVEIGRLTSLMTLALHNNQIHYIPREIGKCKKLQNISLNRNKLTDIPLEIGCCMDLKTLELRDNPSLTVPPTYVVQQGPGVVADYFVRFGKSRIGSKALDLAKLKLKGFPIEVTWTASWSLRELDLCGNTLIQLHYDICNLTNLEILKLEQCRLVGRLTQGLGELTGLKELRLTSNEIEAIPIGLGNAPDLKVLLLDQNWPLKLPPRDVQNKGYPHTLNFLGLLASAERTKHLDFRGMDLVTSDFLEFAVCSTRVGIVPEPEPNGRPWTHLVVLDLSQNRLSSLSNAIGDMTNLLTLLCQRNRIAQIPENTTNLVSLRQLRLDDNLFSEFPAVVCFSDCGSFVEQQQTFGMDVRSLDIQATTVVWRQGPPHQSLHHLDLSGNSIRTIYRALVHLTSLQNLQMSNNKLSKLPPDFKNLTSLKELDLSRNDFAAMPDDIWFLTGLIRLMIGRNKLSEISSNIQNLSQLTELDISENKIIELPLEVGKLRNLSKPFFHGNPLEGIPINLKKSGDLTILACWKAMIESAVTKKFDVSNTGMMALPSQLASMTWLYELDISHNQILELGPQVFQLDSVRILNASHNRLLHLPSAVSKLSALRSLNLRGNNITHLPLELGFCSVLRELIVDEEKILTPSKFVMSLEVNAVMIYLRRLVEAEKTFNLALTGMALPGIPVEILQFTELQELRLDKNKITEIDGDIVYFDTLVTFSACVNQITQLSFLHGDTRTGPWSKPRLANLQVFKVKGNCLTSIPQEITRLKSLRMLQVDNNLITELPNLAGLISLEALTISRNQLTLLPPSISCLADLNRLDVSNNRIWALPFGLGMLQDLNNFVFNNNPIRVPPKEVMLKGQDRMLVYLKDCFSALSTKILDCDELGLYEMPIEVCSIRNLTRLNMSGNCIKFLKDDLTCLNRLELLNISDNKIKTFPMMICDLYTLGDLDISRNPLNSLPVELGQLSILRRLGLEGINLVRPAPEIASLRAQDIVLYSRKYWRVLNGQTRYLDISGIGYSAYPREVTVLGSKLEVLKLDDNKINDLTADIAALYSLLEFSASHNQLYSLPPEIARWTSIQDLKLSNNYINAIPNIRSLRLLTFLDISSNQLTSLPPNMRRWTSLKDMNLSKNKISELFPGIGDLERLTRLNLSDNQLQALPNSIERFSRLCTLDISRNLLKWLPTSVSRVTTLTSLQLVENQISALPPALHLCSNIVAFEITTSKLLVPPPETHNGGVRSMFSYLQSLYLANLNDHLDLSNWRLSACPLDGNFLTGVTHLNLRDNHIRMLPPFIGMYLRLVVFQLDENLLETIPDQIGYLHASLTNLSISHNVLMRLPFGTWKLTSLIHLNLAHNKLNSIPDSLSKLTILRHFNLDFNKVESIPDAVGALTHLQDLWLEGNPLQTYESDSILGCKSMRSLKVEIDHLDFMKKWMKDPLVYSLIAGHGVKLPPTEVVMHGSEALWKYLTLVAASRKTKSLTLSRVSFWVFELSDANQRFYSWPQDLSHYDHLERLTLAGNFLLTIPPTVSNLTNLVELDVEQNRLRSLPIELCACTKLERVMVLRNPDLEHPSRDVTRKGSAALIAFLKCLHMARQDRIIRFENSAYRRIPIELMQYAEITELSLAQNALEILPTEIRNLTNLTKLILNKNLLVMLPEELCLVDGLTSLQIENNKLVALPDNITRLTRLEDFRANGNFLVDAPPEVVKHGSWLVLEFMLQVKSGRITGSVDLSGFDLLDFYKDLAYVDRPRQWTRFHLERFVRCFSEDLNERRKRALELKKQQEIREAKIRQGLDPDLIIDFDGADASWDAINEFFEDATFEYAPGQASRRRDRLRTVENVYESFELWYAFAIGYNSLDEMEHARDSDDDVRKMPGKVEMYKRIVSRFGPPEIELPCVWCIELGRRCHELGTHEGRNMRHDGMFKAARLGWYNIKLRTQHGIDAVWSDDEADDDAVRPPNNPDPTQQEEEEDNEDDYDNDSDLDSEASLLQAASAEDLGPTLTEMLSGGKIPFVHSMNLHNNLIMQVPAEVRALSGLRNLRMSYNLITVLPGEMGDLTNLESLNIAGNRVTSFPYEMSALQKLSVLDMRRNEFRQLPDVIVSFTALTKLCAQANKLHTISEVIGKCEILNELWLQDNKLTSIHPLIGNLERLALLNIGNNCLTTVPPQIGNCYALIALGMYENQFARLPPSLKKLKYLRKLMIGNNSLLDVPEIIMFMHGIEELHVNSNEISKLDVSLCRAEPLRILRFQNNHLRHLPPEIRGLTNLTELRLDGNQLVDICQEISGLTALKLIHLAQNSLNTLPAEMGSLSNLTKLSADCNVIESLPDGFCRMGMISCLWLDSNRLQLLPEGFGGLTSLVELHLDHNRLHKLCSTFVRLTNLTELFMHNNALGLSRSSGDGDVLEEALGVPLEVFELGKLTALTLSGNHLSTIPDQLTKLTNLTELWLHENTFLLLPPPVCSLPSLRYMLLDHDTDTTTTMNQYFDPERLRQETERLEAAVRNGKERHASKSKRRTQAE